MLYFLNRCLLYKQEICIIVSIFVALVFLIEFNYLMQVSPDLHDPSETIHTYPCRQYSI